MKRVTYRTEMGGRSRTRDFATLELANAFVAQLQQRAMSRLEDGGAYFLEATITDI